MKSTQKFLCYSLALVGAALIFTASCKKGDDGAPGSNAMATPMVLDATIIGTASTSNTLRTQSVLVSWGSAKPTEVGFDYSVASITNTVTGSITFSTIPAPQDVFQTADGQFSASALAGGLTYTANSAVTWTITPFAKNSAGKSTAYATPLTVTTTN